MGDAMWYWRRVRAGEFVRLTERDLDRFWDGLMRMPIEPDGFFRFVEVWLRTELRRPVQVVGVCYGQIKANADGWVDLERLEQDHLLSEAERAGFADGPPDPKIAEARKALTGRKVWRPSPEDVEVVRLLINERAGVPLL